MEKLPMRALGFLLLAVLPSLALAEGAVRTLDCQVRQVCDAEGACNKVSDTVQFRMAPQKLQEDGSGKYEISYAQEKAGMDALSYAGPFYWETKSEHDTLLASSETRFVWHRLVLDPTPAAKIIFLDCVLH